MPVERTPPRTSGLTLLELLVVVVVAAVLLATGVPALRHLVLEARMTSTVNALVHDLHLARQAANLKARTVVVCPAAADGGCRGDGQWDTGWTVVVAEGPENGAKRTPLAQRGPVHGIWVHSNRRAFAFRPFSRRDTNGTIGFCDERGPAAVRALVISPTGRPRLASRAEARARVKCFS
jgi:type IV fimbrial biogenesis protein FimT